MYSRTNSVHPITMAVQYEQRTETNTSSTRVRRLAREACEDCVVVLKDLGRTLDNIDVEGINIDATTNSLSLFRGQFKIHLRKDYTKKTYASVLTWCIYRSSSLYPSRLCAPWPLLLPPHSLCYLVYTVCSSSHTSTTPRVGWKMATKGDPVETFINKYKFQGHYVCLGHVPAKFRGLFV